VRVIIKVEVAGTGVGRFVAATIVRGSRRKPLPAFPDKSIKSICVAVARRARPSTWLGTVRSGRVFGWQAATWQAGFVPR
jgi:hypothetical protein